MIYSFLKSLEMFSMGNANLKSTYIPCNLNVAITIFDLIIRTTEEHSTTLLVVITTGDAVLNIIVATALNVSRATYDSVLSL